MIPPPPRRGEGMMLSFQRLLSIAFPYSVPPVCLSVCMCLCRHVSFFIFHFVRQMIYELSRVIPIAIECGICCWF
jgi:hypothetical protein